MKIQKEKLWIHMLGFLVGRAGLFGMYPFAVAFFLAAYLMDESSILLYVVLLLGIFSTLSFQAVIKYSLVILAVTIVLTGLEQKAVRENKLLICLIGGGVTALAAVGQTLVLGGDGWDFAFALLEGVMVAAFAVMLNKGLKILRKKDSNFFRKNENMISIMVLLMLTLFGLPKTVAGVFSILELAVFYVVLYSAHRFGVGVGTGIATICGIVGAMRTGDIEMLGTVVMLGLAVGVGSELGYLGSALGMAAGTAILGSIYYEALFSPVVFRGIASAIVLFLFTPKRYLLKLREISGDDALEKIQRELNEGTKRRITEFGNAFKRVATAFYKEPSDMEETYGSLALAGTLGEVDYMTLCAMNQQVAEGRAAFIRQLAQVGDIISSFSVNLNDGVPVSGNQQALIQERLGNHNVLAKKVLIFAKQDGRQQIVLTAKNTKGRIMTSKEAARIVGDVLEKRLRVASQSRNIIGKEDSVIIMEEDVNYKYLTGARRMTKYGETVSGDNFSLTELSNGQMLLMLADGMGSGMYANSLSELVVEALEQLLEAGFKKELAIRLLNSVISFRNQGNHFTTLDLTMLNLYSGVAEFIKLGASITFIKRGNWIETIQSTSLPVGVVDEVEFDVTSKKLFDGDMLILVSDGVLDAILFENKEEYLKELIMEIDTNNPQEMADSMIENLAKMNHNRMKDDASVLVLGLWKK